MEGGQSNDTSKIRRATLTAMPEGDKSSVHVHVVPGQSNMSKHGDKYC